MKSEDTKIHCYLNEKLNIITNVNELDSQLKNIVLQFLFAFNIFESEFFEEPKWDEQNEDNKAIYKHVYQRIDEIQKLCNDNNYPLDLLEKFQSHFRDIYIEDNIWSERFRTLEKAKFNKNGFNEKEMRYLYDFLNDSLKKHKKHAIQNALLLSYKFRNNMFHGSKDIRNLDKYKNDFIEITDFLINFMKYLRDINAEEF